MDTSGTCGEWNVVLHIFCCGCDVQSNFWSLRKTWKTFTWNLPGFLSRKKDFWVVHPKRLDRKLGHDIFGHLTNNVAVIVQSLRLLCLASEKFHVYPATQVHPIPKTNVFLDPRAVWNPKEKFECQVFSKALYYPVLLSHFLHSLENHTRRAIFPDMCQINESIKRSLLG